MGNNISGATSPRQNIPSESQLTDDEPAQLKLSIKMFETFSGGEDLVSPKTQAKKKYDLSKFLPAPSDKPPEIVKSTPSGHQRSELTSSSGRVSMLAKAFEVPNDDKTRSPLSSPSPSSSFDKITKEGKIKSSEALPSKLTEVENSNSFVPEKTDEIPKKASVPDEIPPKEPLEEKSPETTTDKPKKEKNVKTKSADS